MFRPDEAIEILSRTPVALDGLLGGLSAGWTGGPDPGEDWTPFDIVGHLIHGERTDWVPRMRIILEHGEERPFEPFDRYAQEEESRGKTIADLLDTFRGLREENLGVVAELGLDDAALAKRGTHPELGAVTLAQLIATWAAHDLAHLAQITEGMAKRYREEVGPWRAYLPVLDRED